MSGPFNAGGRADPSAGRNRSFSTLGCRVRMNVERMTQRFQEALNTAYSRALSERQTQTTPEHVLAAVLDQPEGIAAPILAKAGLDASAVTGKVDQAIGQLPRFSGSNP